MMLELRKEFNLVVGGEKNNLSRVTLYRPMKEVSMTEGCIAYGQDFSKILLFHLQYQLQQIRKQM